METNEQPVTTENPGSNGCISCGNLAVVKGFPNALCESCREGYIKYPIPKGIKFFALGISLIFLFSVYKIPKNILLGIHLDKGNTALEQKKYRTAQKELQLVADKIPEDIEVQSNLLIASFYNQDFVTMNNMYSLLEGKRYEDMALYNQVNDVINKTAEYYPGDSMTAIAHRYDDDFTKIPVPVIRKFIEENKDDPYPQILLANKLFTEKSYTEADSILKNLLLADPQNIPALNLMAVLKREMGNPDESINYCDKVLAINKESVLGLSSKSRTYLKQKKDAEATALALRSYNLDDHNYHAAGSLILAYHFTNKIKERDDLLHKMTALKDSASAEMLQYVRDIIDGKEFFRN